MSISIQNISHSYGQQFALQDISIEVEPGEIVALLGPSGCGKTTLLRLIAGLEVVQQGSLQVNQQVFSDPQKGLHLSPEKRGIGMMFQDYALFPHMSVRQNIEYGLLQAEQRQKRQAWLEEMAKTMGLSGMLERFPHTLSGGQQQRVALLRALASEPSIMLLDEPFSALDEHLRQQVREETLDMLNHSGACAVMVTHDPLEAMFIADKIVVMDKGEIVQIDQPQTIYERPANAFVAALFGPANSFNAQLSSGKLSTAIGSFDYPQGELNSNYSLIIRAKDIQVNTQQDGVAAIVKSIHPMGNETHIRVTVAGFHDVIQVRSPGFIQLQAGDTVYLKVEAENCFIYPVTNG